MVSASRPNIRIRLSLVVIIISYHAYSRNMEWSFIISWGKNGGIYTHNEFSKRLCLWRLAITIVPMDYDDIVKHAIKKGADDPKKAKSVIKDADVVG